ncbi:hypothetical protein DM2_316 [Halorubrum sp. DM2]|nr:hypothetical protein DM2_316 [Halorubrum sp. DM2]
MKLFHPRRTISDVPKVLEGDVFAIVFESLVDDVIGDVMEGIPDVS